MATEASRVQAIREKVEAGQRLSFEDGLALEESNDLFALGEMANLVRERYNGNFGYYNVNTHINPTNVCVYKCDFCAFRADLNDARAYTMDEAQIKERAAQAHGRGATELHIVGGLHHKLPFQYYVDVVRWVKEAAPRDPRQGVHRRRDRVVRQDRAAADRARSSSGWSTPGWGACRAAGPRSSTPRSATRSAAPRRRPRSGSTSTGPRTGSACTRTRRCSTATSSRPEHRIDHLIRLRELQDETGGFQTFIPLAFHPDNSRMDDIPKPSGVMDLKTMAISRLMLDNFPHIKAYWVMLGIKTAQVALSFGADDIDGTVVHEKIYHEAGAETPQEVTVAEIRRLIAEAGRIPVERDTLYHRVERDGARWASREHIDVPTLAVVGK